MKKTILFGLLLVGFAAQAQPQWPAMTQTAKPWTRWWWMGSAVDNQNLTRLLEQYERAGLGGVEITPIYGVKGEEKSFIPFLSPTWMDRLGHTLNEAKRLKLGVDLAQASGWPFGGPWVSQADACRYVAYQTYELKPGESLKEAVSYMQKPIMRTVGEPIDIKKLIDPIAKNPDLQRHAFDQVRFEKPISLQTLMAYSSNGQTLDLTTKVGSDGRLNWTAPANSGNWTLYGVFQGWHGKQVERAGPGGEGDVIDHFSRTATQHYLQHFDQAFRGRDLSGIRAFFNDSYEVDDAQGEGNWTPALFAEFQKRRGYDLRAYLPALFGKDADDKNKRVLSDYRETISELLLENYTKTWSEWAKGKGKLIRNQAHGSPANILDLYAVTDIPEIEGTDLLRIKFASSAGNVMGKKLISSESATWNNEHFVSTLSDVKKDMDRFLLGGVNHTFYHGTNYSPQSAAWPGWLFYAAVHFNPNNTFWDDFGTLNRYVARCQSFLQQGKPANNVLVYLPIYDAYTRTGNRKAEPVLLQHFDGIEHGFKGLPVEGYTETLLKRGYGFDFISDKQVQNVVSANGKLITGGVAYQTIVVPESQVIPLATMAQLMKLAGNGATVVMAGGLPQSVNGLGNREARQTAFTNLLAKLKFADTKQQGVQRAAFGLGEVLLGKDVDQLLEVAAVKREILTDQGLQFVRRKHENGHYYFVANWSEKAVAAWVPVQTTAQSAALYNPMTGQTGMANLRSGANGATEVYLQLAPGESCVLDTRKTKSTTPLYAYGQPTGDAQPLNGTWTINFVKGGPELPAPIKTDKLGSWTEQDGEAVKKFSGTATYTLTFPKPTGTATHWQLDLGRVAESARVQLNGQDLGSLIGPTFQLTIPASQLKESNTLIVSVSNGMANRIADMDRNGANWKKFYNINMSARLRENRGKDGLFTAENWKPRASGLLGPVTLLPLGEGNTKRP